MQLKINTNVWPSEVTKYMAMGIPVFHIHTSLM